MRPFKTPKMQSVRESCHMIVPPHIFHFLGHVIAGCGGYYSMMSAVPGKRKHDRADKNQLYYVYPPY